MKKTIYLIRHGETEHNRDRNKFSGISDIPLALAGMDQCKKLAVFFQKKDGLAVYTSPLNRAVESAKLIFPTITPIVAEGLKEFDYGTYEGISKEELSKNDPIVMQWKTQPADLTFPNGGNVRQHAESSYKAFLELVQNSKFEIMACISHKTTIRLLLSQIFGLDLNLFRRIPCSNCGISEVSCLNQRFLISSLNVIPSYLNTMMEV